MQITCDETCLLVALLSAAVSGQNVPKASADGVTEKWTDGSVVVGPMEDNAFRQSEQ
jgi:hypothetical protein